MSATSKRNRALQAGIEPVTGKDLHLEADMAIDMAAAAPEVQAEPRAEQENDDD